MIQIVGVKEWAVTLGFAIFITATMAALIGGWAGMYRSRPEAPESCFDTAEIRGYGESAYRCFKGARLEIYPTGHDRFLAKCVCPPFAPVRDGGVQ